MKEIWKEIPRLPNGKYQVSNFGRVKSKRWVMKFESNHYWHQRIKLYWAWWRNDVKHYQVHRLVYCVFNWLDYNEWLDADISKCSMLVLHKDNNPFNNRLDNLYTWTQKDNMSQCSREGRIKYPTNDLTKKKLNKEMAKLVKKYLREWMRWADVAANLWLKRTTVYDIKMGHTRKNV